MRAPERVECAVEDEKVLSTMHQQGAARVVHVRARADVYMLQRFDDVEESPDVHFHAERSQQPPEDEHVADEGIHGAQLTVTRHERPGRRAPRLSPRRCRPWT